MPTPLRSFLTVSETAARWQVSPQDIVTWALDDAIALAAVIPVCETRGERIVSGIVMIDAADVAGLFRRDGASATFSVMRRFRRCRTEDWEWIARPTDGVTLTAADVIIPRVEFEHRERAWGLFDPGARDQGANAPRLSQRVAGPGAPPKHDWDAFAGAIARRVHDCGMPASQGELVRDMMEWFSSRVASPLPDERTVRRKVSAIWKELTVR